VNHTQLFHFLSFSTAGLNLLLSFLLCSDPSATLFRPDQPESLGETSPEDAPRSPPAAVSPANGPGNTLRLASGARPTSDSTPFAHASSAAPESTDRSAPERELLVKSAARLENQDFDGAIHLLHRYLQRCPDAMIIRLQLAELLFQRNRLDESRWQFAIAVEQMEEAAVVPVRYALHAHSRLMEIAQSSEEHFEEELHRGIGLLLLAEKRLAEPNQQEVTAEELLGRAQTALQRARRLRPQDARPLLFLVQVWLDLQQRDNARAFLALAERLAFSSSLTPSENARLARLALEWR
jgi:hypothetical protein